MTNDEEREAITAAMRRLLDGVPQRSSGALDIVTLAAEAGLKRNRLTHKHTDLKDQFYVEKAARSGMTQRETILHDEIVELKRRLDTLRAERDRYRAASEVFARGVNVLTIENDNLRRRVSDPRTAGVTPLRRR